MSGQRLCIDCKHFDRGIGPAADGKCKSPQNNTTKEASRIDGSFSYRANWTYAFTHRKRDLLTALILEQCGKRGRWFESNNLNEGKS